MAEQKSKASESKEAASAPVASDEKTLAKVRAALREEEGFGQGRADLIIGAIHRQGVRFVE